MTQKPTPRAASPWASGPRELLRHGLELLSRGSDADRRLAMIIIDNSVELTIKTFLGLPKRITGIHVPRARYQEIAESFPKLLDALEEFSPTKLDGIDLGEIEWYHRLRNQLYHQGNGLTVESDKVTVYAELARLLFLRLFDEDLKVGELPETQAIGAFMFKWARFEKGVINFSEFVADTYGRTPNVLAAARILVEENRMPAKVFERFRHVQAVRNKLVHGQGTANELLSQDVTTALDTLEQWLKEVDAKYVEGVI